MGDLLLVAAQMLTGMFIFELIYRVKISPVSVAHHIESIMVAQAAIAISVNRDRESSTEFKLCTVWGKHIFHELPSLSLKLWRDFTHRSIWYHCRIPSPCGLDSLACVYHIALNTSRQLAQVRLHHHICWYDFRNGARHVHVRSSLGLMASCIQNCYTLTAYCIVGKHSTLLLGLIPLPSPRCSHREFPIFITIHQYLPLAVAFNLKSICYLIWWFRNLTTLSESLACWVFDSNFFPL